MAEAPELAYRSGANAAPIVRLTFEPEGLPSLVTLMQRFPQDWPEAVSRALNRAADRARTQIKRILAANMGLRQKDFTDPHRWSGPRGALNVHGSTPQTLSAVLTIASRRIPLYYFGASPKATSGTRRPPGGIRYRIGIGGRKALPHAFMASGRRGRSGTVEEVGTSGHVGVFERWGPKRPSWRGRGLEQRIFERFGPSIPHVAERDPEVKTALNQDLTAWIEQRLAGEVDRLTRLQEQRAQKLRQDELIERFGLEQAKHGGTV